jgi:hypothetical protein
MPVAFGDTYYIIVEGFSSNCGDYSLSVSTGAPGEVPIAGWAVGIAIFLIASVAVIRYFKLT